MKKIPVFLMSFVMIFACLIVGCTKLTVIRNEVETCAALSTKLVSAFYNKEDKDDADFMAIVADLTEKINAVIESL